MSLRYYVRTIVKVTVTCSHVECDNYVNLERLESGLRIYSLFKN